jgi:hypothetical protein
MSNGLFAVDGVDVAGLVAEHLGPRVLPCVLYKPGAPAERDPAHPTRAPELGPERPLKARGFIGDFSERLVDGNLIVAGDRKVTLLAGTVEDGEEPQGGYGLLIEGTRYVIHRVVARDPAGATFTLQVRRP